MSSKRTGSERECRPDLRSQSRNEKTDTGLSGRPTSLRGGMNTLVLLIGALCVLVIGYRFYGAFLAAKVLPCSATSVCTPWSLAACRQKLVKNLPAEPAAFRLPSA